MPWTTDDEIAWNKTNPFRQHLGVEIEWVRDDSQAQIAIPITANLLQAYGMVHGGIYCTLIDTVLGTSVRAALQRDAKPSTIDLNVSFLRPTGLGRIYARGKIIKAGKRVAVGTADVVDENERLVATGRGSFMIEPS